VTSTPTFHDHEGPGPRRDVVGYGRHVPNVQWPGGARVALSLCLVYEEGSEYSLAHGDTRQEGAQELPVQLPPEHRDLGAESVWEDGSRAGVWRLARLFDELGVPVTVMAPAVALERNPAVGEWIAERGHEPCAHGWRHEEAWTLTKDEERARIRAAVESIERTCRMRPRGWISRYSPSVHTRELLVEEGGFVYDSDAFNDDLPYHVDVGGKRHLVVPHTFTYNDGRALDPSLLVDASRRGLDYLWREGGRMMTIALHARLAGQAARAAAVEELVRHAQDKRDVWIARRIDIANWWTEHFEEFQR
jgi:peptidoglycan/xylan/chitin deacetylase (PgdA/CDA1 family)